MHSQVLPYLRRCGALKATTWKFSSGSSEPLGSRCPPKINQLRVDSIGDMILLPEITIGVINDILMMISMYQPVTGSVDEYMIHPFPGLE